MAPQMRPPASMAIPPPLIKVFFNPFLATAPLKRFPIPPNNPPPSPSLPFAFLPNIFSRSPPIYNAPIPKGPVLATSDELGFCLPVILLKSFPKVPPIILKTGPKSLNASCNGVSNRLRGPSNVPIAFLSIFALFKPSLNAFSKFLPSDFPPLLLLLASFLNLSASALLFFFASALSFLSSLSFFSSI